MTPTLPPPSEATQDWEYQFRVNGFCRSWREIVGYCLRRLAQWIDGRITLGISISSTPTIPPSRRMDCVRVGLAAMRAAVADETRSEAEEMIFRRTQGHLFADLGDSRYGGSPIRTHKFSGTPAALSPEAPLERRGRRLVEKNDDDSGYELGSR